MRLRKITLEGFQSYREHEDVDLQGLSLTAIHGKNHAGKSTLISNALDFALYGRSRSDTIGDVISRGAPRVSVSVEFDLGDSTYRVTRSRTAKGSPEAILEVSDEREENGWRALTEKNPLSTDPVILELLGMNAQTAGMTWMIRQNDYGAFCDLAPAQRRNVLADAFGLSKFADLAKRAETAKKGVNTQLDRATYDLENTRSRIEALHNDGPFPDVADDEIETQAKEAEDRADTLAAQLASLGDNTEVKERHQAAQEALTFFLKAHEREVAQYKTQRSQMEQYLLAATQRAATTREAVNEATTASWSVEEHQEDLQDAKDAVNTARGQVQTAQQAVTEAETALEAARAEEPELSGQVGSAMGRAESAKAQAQEIHRVIESLKESVNRGEGVCLACQRPMSNEEARQQAEDQERKSQALKEEHDAALAEAERIRGTLHEVRARVTAARNTVGEARNTLAQAQQAEAQAQRAVDNAQRTLDATQALAATLPERKSAASEAADALAEAQASAERFGDEPALDEKRHASLTVALEKARNDLEATQGGEQRRVEITQERAGVRDRARRLWQEQQRRAQVSTELASLQEPLKKAEAQVAELTQKAETYGVLMEAFKPSGIPFMILSGVIEELNEEANEVISELGDDGLAVHITTASENRNGGTAEKVMVYAITSDGQANYSALSGSEQTRVALAIRLGLAQCIARRSGTPIETIVADECWGMFDDAGKRALMNVFIRLSERFSVFSVSHIPDVTDAFPDTIEVDMSTGTSRATVRTGR